MDWRDIIIWILVIISGIMIFWYIFGNTPTIEQAWLVLIVSILFITNTQVVRNGTRLNLLERRFNKLACDFTEHIKHKK